MFDVLERESLRLTEQLSTGEETLRAIERELVPGRQAVAALVQEDISAIDVALGKISERERQIGKNFCRASSWRSISKPRSTNLKGR